MKPLYAVLACLYAIVASVSLLAAYHWWNAVAAAVCGVQWAEFGWPGMPYASCAAVGVLMAACWWREPMAWREMWRMIRDVRGW